MSWRHARWALDLRGLSMSEKALLLVLVIRADNDGNCSASIAALAADACMNKKTVASAARFLEQRGLISRHRRWGGPVTYQLTTTGAALRASGFHMQAAR